MDEFTESLFFFCIYCFWRGILYGYIPFGKFLQLSKVWCVHILYVDSEMRGVRINLWGGVGAAGGGFHCVAVR